MVFRRAIQKVLCLSPPSRGPEPRAQVQLHPWGPGGGTHGAAFGDDGFAITQIRLAQNLV